MTYRVYIVDLRGVYWFQEGYLIDDVRHTVLTANRDMAWQFYNWKAAFRLREQLEELGYKTHIE